MLHCSIRQTWDGGLFCSELCVRPGLRRHVNGMANQKLNFPSGQIDILCDCVIIPMQLLNCRGHRWCRLAKLALLPTIFNVVAPVWVAPSNWRVRGLTVQVTARVVPEPLICIPLPAVRSSSFVAMPVLYAEVNT